MAAAELLTGTITATAPTALRLDGAGSASPAKRLASYPPTVGDRVICVRYGTQLVILGTIVNT